MKKIVCLALYGLMVLHASAQKEGNRAPRLLFSYNFSRLDTGTWITEMAPLPDSKVYAADGKLVLDTKGGVTVWLNKKLCGNIRIEYSRKVLPEGGKNNRISDLNTFWMASDPRQPHLFTRRGVLEEYDSLKMYYVGMGGNTNSTTRFRKYEGNGERTLLQEYKDPAHLLSPGKEYRVLIEMRDGLVRFLVNDQLFFSYKDPTPLRDGYFGFRSTKSHQAINWIKVYQLD